MTPPRTPGIIRRLRREGVRMVDDDRDGRTPLEDNSGAHGPQGAGIVGIEHRTATATAAIPSSIPEPPPTGEPCCPAGCTTRAEMRARHGTPAEFREAAWACPDITGAEAQAGADAYDRVWARAPDGDPLVDLLVAHAEAVAVQPDAVGFESPEDVARLLADATMTIAPEHERAFRMSVGLPPDPPGGLPRLPYCDCPRCRERWLDPCPACSTAARPCDGTGEGCWRVTCD